MSFSDIAEIVFSTFGQLWSFINDNPLLQIGVFGPFIVVVIVMIIKAFRG